MNKHNKFLLTAILGFLLALLLFKGCNGSKTNIAEEKTTIDTIFIPIEKKIFIKDTIVNVQYKNKYVTKETIEEKFDGIDYQDYSYTLDTLYKKNNSETNLKINGWGYIHNIELNTTFKDSTIVINKEITKTILKPSKGLYLSPEYIRPFNIDDSNKPTYRVNLDYINGNLLLGTGIGIQNEQPNWSIRIGYKLK